jgi:hypothetical protein
LQLTSQTLKEAVHRQSLSRTQQLLLCLAANGEEPKSVERILEIAKEAGIPSAGSWDIGELLRKSRSQAIKTPGGWELGPKGRTAVVELIGGTGLGPGPAADTLRAELKRITDLDTKAFVDEAIRCYERGLFRAAVVLAWVGAVSVLYKHVIDNKLADFNSEAVRRFPKWKSAKNADDLVRMKEHDFLQVLDGISVIGKSVREELEGCLKLRNGCGHPNSLKIAGSRVAAHIEVLVLNVFSRFPS